MTLVQIDSGALSKSRKVRMLGRIQGERFPDRRNFQNRL